MLIMTLDKFDFLDPRLWPEERPQTIYLTKDLTCTVDEIDYPFLAKHLWTVSNSRSKRYAMRNVGPAHDRKMLYMHKLVLYRMGLPPSDKHVVGDHINGNGLDNRRCNLRWATISENNKNVHGYYMTQSQFAFEGERYAKFS